jgi:lipoate-protein ligase B
VRAHNDAVRAFFSSTGVWIENEQKQITKIASLGVAVRRWITYHGISINVSNDLAAFQMIRPCNFESSIMTSMKAEGVDISVAELSDSVIQIFKNIFSQDRNALDIETEDFGGGTALLSMPANF